ncbi:MAG: DEAD/DEAH box helicase, partial [Gammaproteobacteria bacterium]|nr:DEAD/DEAH box helicase [Gammaproteobacteria bacterium]
YLLFDDLSAGRQIFVKPVCIRGNSDGGYGEEKTYHPSWALRGTPPSFLTKQDMALLAALDQLTYDDAVAAYAMEGGPAVLIRDLLLSGRCYWRNVSQLPLRWGESRPATPQWAIDDAGWQSFELTLSPPATSVYAQPALFFVDQQRAECGGVRSAIDESTLAVLLAMPAVAPQKSEHETAALAQRFPDDELPPLQQFEIKRLPAQPPVPVARLITVNSGGRAIALLSLCFDYGTYRETRYSPGSHLNGFCIERISCDDAAEQRCVAQLQALGFRADDSWTEDQNDDLFYLSARRVDWLRFQQQGLAQLREQGWRVEVAADFHWRLAVAERWHGRLESADSDDWFRFGLDVDIDGQRVNLLPVIVELLNVLPAKWLEQTPSSGAKEAFLYVPLEDGSLLPVPEARVRAILTVLYELYDSKPLDSDQMLPLNRYQMMRLGELQATDDTLHWSGGDGLHDLRDALRGMQQIPVVSPAADLRAELRDYQQHGLNWLQYLREHGLAGVLADDMGLGKTVQALAHLLAEVEKQKTTTPSLVIAPTSLMFNWRREAQRFTPDLKVLVLHGPRRRALFSKIPAHDLVLTTYPLLVRDFEKLRLHRYHLLILDEAQVIKNPAAKSSQLVRQLLSRHRLCLTGTPMENHLGELWSLFDFLLPGLLGSEKQFKRHFRTPIEKQHSKRVAEQLAARIAPFVLRRTKEAVAKELPAKTEIINSVVLESKQRELYEIVRLATYNKVRQEVAENGMERCRITILDALLKLRQVCCDPRLVKTDAARSVNSSAKLELLMAMLPEMVEEGRRILLFSQFTSMLALIEEAVTAAAIPYVTLTGSTKNREQPVARFQNGDVPLFLISLKAGGVGLNLTAADTVIHYDPWWNPAVEQQATARAHRIGQKNPVFAYKLIVEGSVEEKIVAMQARKQQLAQSIYGDGGDSLAFNEADLDALFQPLS